MTLILVEGLDQLLYLTGLNHLPRHKHHHRNQSSFDEKASQALYEKLKNHPIYSWEPLLPYKEAKEMASEEVDYSEKGILPCTTCVTVSNTVVRSIAKTKSSHKVIYDVPITIDIFGRRWTPQAKKPQYNIVMLGDSYTFGEGLKDDQTIEYFLSQMRPEAQLVNMGNPGNGPNDIYYELTRLPALPRTLGVSLQPSVILYNYMDNHMERLICRSLCLREENVWMTHKPSYELDSDGSLQFKGFFAEDRWLLNSLYRAFNSLHFVKDNNINLPPRYTSENYRLFATVVEQMMLKSMEMYQGLDFYFVLLPGGAEVHGRRIAAEVAKRGIKVLDYTNLNLITVTGGKSQLPLDGHPTPVADYVTAYLFNRDLPSTQQVLGQH